MQLTVPRRKQTAVGYRDGRITISAVTIRRIFTTTLGFKELFMTLQAYENQRKQIPTAKDGRESARTMFNHNTVSKTVL